MADWEQQPGESGAAYGAFCVFRDLGPGRELTAAYRQAAGKPEARQSSGCWNSWAGRYRWADRARAYDAHLEAVQLRAREQAAAGRVERWERERDRQLELDLEAGRQIVRQGRYLAGFPVATETVTRDGTAVTYTAADPRALVAGARMAALGSALCWGALDRALAVSRAEAGAVPVIDDPRVHEHVSSELRAWQDQMLARAEAFFSQPPPTAVSADREPDPDRVVTLALVPADGRRA